MVRKSIKIAFMYLHNQNVGKDLIVLNPCKDGLATPRLVKACEQTTLTWV